jgi:hypothetical protein
MPWRGKGSIPGIRVSRCSITSSAWEPRRAQKEMFFLERKNQRTAIYG